jgi:signal transduction histidine kinase/DNA-binding NarL/FixJ family response regulator
MIRLPKTKFRSRLIAMFLSLFVVTWAGVAVTAHQTVSKSVDRILNDHKLWLAVYSESFLLDLQAGNTISVERKLKLLVNRKIYSSIEVNFGSNVITATSQDQTSMNRGSWYGKYLPDNTISTELRDASNARWGILTATVDENYLYSPIYESIDSFLRYSIALFLSYLGLCLLMGVSFEGPITALANYFDLFLSVDEHEYEKLSNLLDQRFDLNVVELNALALKFKGVIRRVTELHRKMRDFDRVSGIAQTTQMLAHDVRKPFSMLRMAMAMLGNARDPEAVKSVMQRIVPEIDKAMSSVDGMIADVMEVGSTSVKLIQEPASPESLIESTLGEVIRMYREANISFSYDLKHSHMVNVHVQKMGRVFSNIVGNAFQAMRNKGAIWFKTTESNGMIQFCIGNAGSVIPAESLPKLFEAFFTSGKKGGTGLGLAIAQKVVNAHGGKIWCESSKTTEHPHGKVEFFFTIPIADQINRTTATLPQQSSDIAKQLVLLTANAPISLSIDKGEISLEEDLVQAHTNTGRILRVLVVDDEAIYRGAMNSFLSRTPELASAVEITQAEGSVAALNAVSTRDFDLIITDVDMGAASLDGFELVRKLREKGSESLICVHSNRIVAADNKSAIEAGADNFMPKPMARAQLLRIVLQAAEASRIRDQEATTTAEPQSPDQKPAVLVIDDAALVIYAWEDMLAADTTLYTMSSFEELTARIEADPSFLFSLNYVVTDMHLDGSYGDGLDVGRLIKKVRPDLPVLMSSNDIFKAQELVGAIDRVIAKEPVGIAQLKALVKGTASV